MRINVYSQELTDEVIKITKESNTGVVYHAAQLVLHSSPMLHSPPDDDDRSAVTFWLPHSEHRRESMAKAFEEIARVFRGSPLAAGRDRDRIIVTPSGDAPERLRRIEAALASAAAAMGDHLLSIDHGGTGITAAYAASAQSEVTSALADIRAEIASLGRE